MLRLLFCEVLLFSRRHDRPGFDFVDEPPSVLAREKREERRLASGEPSLLAQLPKSIAVGDVRA